MAEHEVGALLLSHLLTASEGLEVVLARAAGGKHQQHRRPSRAAEAVNATLGDVEEVAGASGHSLAAVVEPDLA